MCQEKDKLRSPWAQERSSSEVTLSSSWPLHHILGTELLSFGAYVSLELKNGHLRGKFIPVLGLRGCKANFFQEKAGNALEKQTAAPLQNPLVPLPVSTIGLFLQAQLLTFKNLNSCDSKTAPFQPFYLAPRHFNPSLTWGFNWRKKNQSQPKAGLSLDFPNSSRTGAVFFPKSHKASKTGILI